MKILLILIILVLASFVVFGSTSILLGGALSTTYGYILPSVGLSFNNFAFVYGELEMFSPFGVLLGGGANLNVIKTDLGQMSGQDIGTLNIGIGGDADVEFINSNPAQITTFIGPDITFDLNANIIDSEFFGFISPGFEISPFMTLRLAAGLFYEL